MDWLRTNASQFASVLDIDLRQAPGIVMDLSVGSLLLGADPAAFDTDALTETIFGEMKRAGVQVGIGRYDEARLVYLAFRGGDHPTAEHRTVHLGIDLFVEACAPVNAPLDGAVYCVANNTARLDYGPLIILRHTTDYGQDFFTLYGHLSEESLLTLTAGQTVKRGQRIASIGTSPTNGDWPPHLHLQIITDLLDSTAIFPAWPSPVSGDVWKSLSPDPNLITGIPRSTVPPAEPTKSESLAARRERIGRI